MPPEGGLGNQLDMHGPRRRSTCKRRAIRRASYLLSLAGVRCGRAALSVGLLAWRTVSGDLDLQDGWLELTIGG